MYCLGVLPIVLIAIAAVLVIAAVVGILICLCKPKEEQDQRNRGQRGDFVNKRVKENDDMEKNIQIKLSSKYGSKYI